MRKNQVEIKVTRFNDEIPVSVKEKDNVEQEMVSYEMNTYADSNDVFEALAAAYLNILEQIKKDENFPKFGDGGQVLKRYRYKTSKYKDEFYGG